MDRSGTYRCLCLCGYVYVPLVLTRERLVYATFFYAVHACALLCCALVTIIIIIMHGTKTQEEEEEEEEEREAKSKYAARMHALCIPSDPSRESTLLHYARKFALSFCAWAHILSHVRYVTEGSCSCASVFSTTTVTNVKCSSTTVPAAVKYMK